MDICVYSALVLLRFMLFDFWFHSHFMNGFFEKKNCGFFFREQVIMYAVHTALSQIVFAHASNFLIVFFCTAIDLFQ